VSDFAKWVEAARFAVAEACAVCRRVQRELDDVRSMLKDDRSPVTVADFASQAVIGRALAEGIGKVRLVAEEDSDELRTQIGSGARAYADLVVEAVREVWPGATLEETLEAIDIGNADPPKDSVHGFWTLDPIDGTKGFLRGGQYAVSLAYIENGSPLIGVVGCPNLSADFGRAFDDPDPHGTLYEAVAGEGVYEIPADDPGGKPTKITRLEPAEGEPIRMCESVESGHTSHDASERVLERLGEPAEPARLDSQAKYVVVGRGQADVYLRLPRPPKPGKGPYVERIWDHAAGSLVAREAGAAVSDALGAPLDFGCGVGLERNRGIVVAPPGLHGRAIEAIADLGIAGG
jgi:HAL2 family 3'(2'),5'-bisphosphate nucleotidase